MKEPTYRRPTPYPKMLYKGDQIYGDSDQIKEDLQSKKIKTVIVADEEQEAGKRDDGWVNLSELIAPPRKTPVFASKEKPIEQQSGDELWKSLQKEELVQKYVAKHGKKPHHRMTAESIAKAL